jgi:uncharacterized protein (DUF1501 family)
MKTPDTPNAAGGSGAGEGAFGQPNCAQIGSTSMYSLISNLAMTGRASAPADGSGPRYRALVCLFLDGGNDSYNMLAPLEADEFRRYEAARADLAIGRSQWHEIRDDSNRERGRQFGVHPSMPEVAKLYRSGELSFVCNVGTLVEPTDLNAINRSLARLPLGLYSHADQVMQWQTSTPDRRQSVGWAGRAAEILQALNEKDSVSMNISLSGTNIFQSGRNLVPYSITPDGASLLSGYSDPSRAYFRDAVDSLLELQYRNLLKQTYSSLTRQSIDSGHRFLRAWHQAKPIATSFPESQLGKSLRGVAQGIAAREHLGMRRQTYFVRHAGWDHHDEVLANQGHMLGVLDQAVGAFWRSVTEMGLQDSVVLFTASDFGRTLSSNGKGSDHGWGGNQFVLGGAHSGGRIYGKYPEDLSLGNSLDTGRGRLIPTLSVDEYYCELARWLGVGNADMTKILPNLERFHHLGEKSPLGML